MHRQKVPFNLLQTISRVCFSLSQKRCGRCVIQN